MKRLITIIIIILILAAIVFGISWIFSRRTAQKNGTTPLTFREFVTGKSGDGSEDPQRPGSISSDFTDPQGQGGAGSPIPTTSTNPNTPRIDTNSSTFTNTGFAPVTSIPPITTPNQPGGGGVIGGNPTTPTLPGGGTTAPTTPGTVTPIAVCTDADLNITFTEDELQKLQALQDRFYEVATTLHNDGDAQTQLSNYNALKSKLDRYRELNRYCVDKLAPKIANFRVSDFVPEVEVSGRIGGLYDDNSGHNNNGIYMYIKDAFKNKVPTPFWFELADIRLNPPRATSSIFNRLGQMNQFASINNFSQIAAEIQRIRAQQANGNNSQALTAEQIQVEQQMQAAIQSGVLGNDSIPIGYLSPITQIAGDVGACQGYDCPTIFRNTMEAYLRLNLW